MKNTEMLIRSAIKYLMSEHIQNNKHRLGLLGAEDIGLAIYCLEKALELQKKEGIWKK
jgi:hypothetical protein